MEIIKYYKAFDGETFDTEEECIKHEDFVNKVYDNVKFYGENNTFLPYKNLENEFDKAYNDAKCVNILDSESSKYLYYYTGYSLPETEGLFRYDIDSESWHKVS